ncbi:MAG: RsiV family protein [Muribaculaceae bacterium]|nr:RsiV family protein [Muribaculaceae bacterium]MDE6330254.1 RsiV family protein [Muribaculaceae bacterium]
MKRLHNGILAMTGAALAMAGMTACGGNNDDKNGISFESFSFSEVADGADSDSLRNVIDDFDGRWSVHTDGVLPTRLGKGDIDFLRDSLCNLAGVEIVEGKLCEALPAELTPLDTKTVADSVRGTTPKSEYINQLSVDLLTPKLAVFHNYTYSYPEGAAHGMSVNSYVNYDIQKGEIVTLNRLFTAGFEKLLLPAIRKKLEDSGVELLVEPEEVKMPQQFRITSSGVEFIYGLYEIAPYAEGEPTVMFYSSELSSILTPAGKTLLLGGE